MKTCTKCLQSKSLDSFAYRSRSKNTFQSWCKSCLTAARLKIYYNDPTKHRRYQKERQTQIRTWFQAYKRTLKCARCPENDPVCLDFHHRDPSNKATTLANVIRDEWSVERIRAEIEKCDVLCANCHRKLHAHEVVLG